jgi:hypothetical protein
MTLFDEVTMKAVKTAQDTKLLSISTRRKHRTAYFALPFTTVFPLSSATILSISSR